MNRRFEDLDRARFRHTSKARPKLAIIITNQILRPLPIRGGFPKLLCYPGIRRRAGHADMDHPSRLQFYDEERLRAVERRDRSLVRSRRPRSVRRGCAERSPTSGLVAVRTFLMYFWMVRLHTPRPSFSSSPRILSAPHSRLSFAICLIKAIVSTATLGW
jgi:hypothetical protein